MKFNFRQFVADDPAIWEALPDSPLTRETACELERLSDELGALLSEPLQKKLEALLDICVENNFSHAADAFCSGVSVGMQLVLQLFSAD